MADLSAQLAVRRLAGGEVLQCLPRIEVPVNNVGRYWNTPHVTAGGLERTVALNHLAPLLLKGYGQRPRGSSAVRAPARR